MPSSHPAHEPARRPEDLGRFFIERGNAGDVEGLVALYEPDAVLAFPKGRLTTGSDAIRAVYQELLAGRPTFTGTGQAAIVNGDLALTSTRTPRGRHRRDRPPPARRHLALDRRPARRPRLTPAG
jgi:ketosteroid isomerase-like protein